MNSVTPMSFWAVAAITASAVGGLFTMQMSHAGENGHSSMANRSEVSKVQIKLERVSTKVNHNAEVLSELKEAYERAGLEMRTGYDLRTARRSLNFLMLEWQNRGINLWTVDLFDTPIELLKGVATYDIDIETIALLDLMLRTNDGNVNTQTLFGPLQTLLLSTRSTTTGFVGLRMWVLTLPIRWMCRIDSFRA